MSTQLFEEEAPVAAAPKNGRAARNAPVVAPETPAPAEPEIALSDPFADEHEATPIAPETIVVVEPEPAPPAPVVAPTLPPVVVAPVPIAAASVVTTGPRSLPDERQSLTLTLKAGGCEGLVVVGLFDDGTPGEVLLLLRNAPTGARSALEAFAATLTLALPYGVPAGVLANQLITLVGESGAREAASSIASSLSSRF